MLPAKRGESPAGPPQMTTKAGFTNFMWNDIPADELKELMDEMEASVLHPDEAELERWLESQFSQKT